MSNVMVYLILIAGALFFGISMIALMNPGMLAPLWRPIKKALGIGKGKEGEVKVPTTPKEIMASEIEKLTRGQSLSYLTPKTYGANMYTVELNPEYPSKGKKFSMFTQPTADGKLAGQKAPLWDSNKAIDMANYIAERQGKLYTGAK